MQTADDCRWHPHLRTALLTTLHVILSFIFTSQLFVNMFAALFIYIYIYIYDITI
jgi:hypothetical protein